MSLFLKTLLYIQGLASNSPKSSVDQNSVPPGFKNSFVPTNVAATEIQQPNLNTILEETKTAGDVISGDLDENNVSTLTQCL